MFSRAFIDVFAVCLPLCLLLFSGMMRRTGIDHWHFKPRVLIFSPDLSPLLIIVLFSEQICHIHGDQAGLLSLPCNSTKVINYPPSPPFFPLSLLSLVKQIIQGKPSSILKMPLIVQHKVNMKSFFLPRFFYPLILCVRVCVSHRSLVDEIISSCEEMHYAHSVCF